MIIKNVMTKDPVCVTESTTVTEAKSLMNTKKISKLPVLDSSKRLVGIITKNDIAKVSPSEATTLDMYEISSLLSKLTCGKFMTRKVVAVEETEVVEEAARLMVDKGIGCLPVVKDDVVVGIVTESDLFELFIEMFGARSHGVRANFELEDKPGQLSRIFGQIAELEGNLISVVTRESKDETKRRTTVKVSGIEKDKLDELLKKEGAEILDIRNI